ncbi:MAG: hypothetical protein WCF88_06865, partial [Candidatus Acidiferrales bacterium]
MAAFFRELDSETNTRDSWRPARSPLFWLVLLALLISAANSVAKGAAIQNGAAASTGPGLTIAIADFDGDLRPDLASIQDGHSTSDTSTYWIHF